MNRVFIKRQVTNLKCQVTKSVVVSRWGLTQVWRAFSNSYVCLSCFLVGSICPLFQAELTPAYWLYGATIITLMLTVWRGCFIGLFALALGVMLASMRFHWQLSSEFPPQWERKDIELIGQITGMPIYRDKDVTFRFEVKHQDTSSELAHLIGRRIQLSCYRCPLDVKPEQRWKFTVRVKRPHGYLSPGAFDYEKYLFRNKLVANGYIRLKSPNQLLHGAAPNLTQYRMDIKRRLLQIVDSSSVGANVILALSIGDKSGFTSDHRQVLQDSGLSHLIAISGLHVGLVFVCCFWLFRRVFNLIPWLFEKLPRPYLCLIAAMVCAFVYSALSGFAVSTQRALIMLSLFSISKIVVREPSLLKVLLVAASIILLYDPFSILDIGFWLSCGAVLVIHFAAVKDEKVSLLKLQPVLWIGMAPLTSLFFGQISLLSPLLNLIAVPIFCMILIPATLLAVLISGLGLIFIAEPLLICLDLIYSRMFVVLEPLVGHSLAKVDGPEISLLNVAMFLLLAGMYRYRVKWALLSLPIYLALLAYPAHSRVEVNGLKIALLDVGQGLAMVIHSSAGVTIFDTGSRYTSGFTAAKGVLLPYLRTQGIKKIDRLIVSHADNDHIGGYKTLVQSFPVTEVITSRVDRLMGASECVAGQRWVEAGTVFTFISPISGTPKGSNNRSCVLRVEHGNSSVLITADIEKQVERYLLNQKYVLASDILLVPHHGSKTSSTKQFIDVVNPTLALVSAGYLSHYGHPHKDVIQRYVERGIELVSTANSGTIEINITDNGYTVTRYRDTNRRFWHWRDNSSKLENHKTDRLVKKTRSKKHSLVDFGKLRQKL